MSGDHEPPKARLEVEDEALDPVRGDEDLLGVPLELGGSAKLPDRDEQHRERAADEDGEYPGRQERPGANSTRNASAVPHLHLAKASAPDSPRSFGSSPVISSRRA